MSPVLECMAYNMFSSPFGQELIKQYFWCGLYVIKKNINYCGTSAERNLPPEKLLDRCKKWFENREKGSEKKIQNVSEK